MGDAAQRLHGAITERALWPQWRWWLFPIWLCGFYLAWALLVRLGGHEALLREHWSIAAAMALGSYVAGSTPMGGGTIGFPVLVLLFDQPADIGRQFSFAVQSIGMTSAGIFIFATRRPVAWVTIGWACLGAAVATPIGIALLTPAVNDTFIKLLFAILWASFGLMHFVKVREFIGYAHMTPATPGFKRALGFTVGVIGGGTVAATTGVGVDMLIYTLLVLVLRCDLRTAIPTSVILMAFTSLVGLAATLILRELDPVGHPVRPAVFGNWIAAAPVVAVGAPLGALMVTVIPRVYTLLFVSGLCMLQFVWTCSHERIGLLGVAAAVAAVLACNLLYHGLYRWGARRSRIDGRTGGLIESGSHSGPIPSTHPVGDRHEPAG